MKFVTYHFIVFFIVTFLITGCATQRSIQSLTVVEESYPLIELCDKYNILWQWDHVTQTVILNKADKEARVMVSSRLVLVDNKRILLSKPVMMSKSVVIVPRDFYAKVIQSLKAKRIVKNKKKHQHAQKKYVVRDVKTIVIDAGHGGKDPGALGHRGLKEKIVVLDIAKRLNKILLVQRYKVIMTRRTDKFISLQKRTEIASDKKADIFISIHANSSPAKSARGVEVFSSKNLLYADKNEAQYLKNHRILFKNYNMERSDKNLNKIISDMLYKYKQGESVILANAISEKMKKGLKVKDRGIKHSKFFVLRNNLMPAVLVEVGFLSNTREEKLLGTATYRQKIAESIAQGVFAYVKPN